MTNEMVERGAKAMYERKFRNQGFKWEDSTAQAEWLDLMRTAIEAMREPTEAMKEAARVQHYDGDVWPSDLLTVWTTMINAALK